MPVIVAIYAAAMLPTLTFIVGIVLHRRDTRQLRDEVSELCNRIVQVEMRSTKKTTA